MALLYTVKGAMVSEIPKWGWFVWGQFGQNDQKLHKDYNINFLGAKQWRTWGAS